jgi:putative ATPase
MILWGPAGTGKTTLAYLLAARVGGEVQQLSAVASGVADARKIMERAKGSLIPVVLFVDEVHRWSKAQQDVLLPGVEDGTVTFIGATTENPYFSLITPLLSRCLLLRLEPLSNEDLRELMDRALADPTRGLAKQEVKPTDEALDHLAEIAGGDARIALTGLEAAVLAAHARGERKLSLAVVEEAIQKKAIVYDRQGDAHFDVISAFIKSIRGSDPDATLFWLARMLEAGEDARFIARRLVILASEDVGLADPQSILVANAAAHAVEYVGLPEAALNLAHAVLHLSLAPKSNSVVSALGAASAAVRDRRAGPVPMHLRDSHYRGAQQLGHGAGYVYPHDAPQGWVPQDHMPAEVAGERFYRPSSHGAEPRMFDALEARRHRGSDPEAPVEEGDDVGR